MRKVVMAAKAGKASPDQAQGHCLCGAVRLEIDVPVRCGRIEAYRRGEEPLSVPVALLAHYASGGDFPWLAEQTYLSPFPAGLGLRHAVGA